MFRKVNNLGDWSRDLQWIMDQKDGSRFPLTDLFIDDKTVVVKLALAGFSENDIELEMVGNKLIISGEIEETDEPFEYVQKQISQKPFERTIALHEDYVAGDVSASFVNGILEARIEPIEKERKLISIKAA